MLVSALAEVVSLGAILPFIGVLTAPDRVLEYAIIAQAAAVFGWTEGEQLYLPVSVAFALAALLARPLHALRLMHALPHIAALPVFAQLLQCQPLHALVI